MGARQRSGRRGLVAAVIVGLVTGLPVALVSGAIFDFGGNFGGIGFWGAINGSLTALACGGLAAIVVGRHRHVGDRPRDPNRRPPSGSSPHRELEPSPQR